MANPKLPTVEEIRQLLRIDHPLPTLEGLRQELLKDLTRLPTASEWDRFLSDGRSDEYDHDREAEEL